VKGRSCPVAQVLLTSFCLGTIRSWFAGTPYDIEVFVSGYVVKHKAQTLSRSQRKILGLAKRSLSHCSACLCELNTYQVSPPSRSFQISFTTMPRTIFRTRPTIQPSLRRIYFQGPLFSTKISKNS
jgi:hypothetical protein